MVIEAPGWAVDDLPAYLKVTETETETKGVWTCSFQGILGLSRGRMRCEAYEAAADCLVYGHRNRKERP